MAFIDRPLDNSVGTDMTLREACDLINDNFEVLGDDTVGAMRPISSVQQTIDAASDQVLVTPQSLGGASSTANEVNKLVKRDSNGDFSANVITATLNGDADTLDGKHASDFASAGHTHSNYLVKTGDTMTGRLVFPDAGYSIGNEYHTWKRSYVINNTSPANLLYHDGTALDAGGVYRFHAHIAGTSTDQSATAVFWNQNGTWRVNVTYQSGTDSNHPEFIIGGSPEAPQIHIDHTTNYTVEVLGERLELSEDTGTDNQSGFGTDAFLGSVGGVLRYNDGGTANTYDQGNKVFHDGYHPNADKWTTARTLTLNGDVSGSVSVDGSANVSITTTVADDSHNHTIANVDGLQTALNGKVDDSQVLTNVPAGAVFTDTVYTHPSYAGDDINLDTGALSGATVISDLDFNVTTDTLGHVTDANATYSTRNLTAGDIGALPVAGKAADSDKLDGLSAEKYVRTLANYNTTSSVGRLMVKLPYLTTSAKMLSFDIDMYTSYVRTKISISGYLYPSINNWYSPTATIESTGTSVAVTMGRTSDGYAYVSIPVAAYTGIKVSNLTVAHGGSTSDYLLDGWQIIDTDDVPNTVSVSTITSFHDGYHPNADKWTTARTLSLTGDVTGSVSWDGSANASITATVADDSHNHTIANVDGLQTALDGKLSTTGKAADSNKLDNLDSSQFLRSDTADSTSGTITLTDSADLRFQDTNGTFPTSAGGFQWTLNNDQARIYAQQPSSDQIDLFFKISDNAGSTDRFVYWVDDYRGATYDKYPAQFDGSAQYLSIPVDGSGKKDLANARFKVPYSGDVVIDNNKVFHEGNGATNAETLTGTITNKWVSPANVKYLIENSGVGAAAQADKLTTARTISLTGDVTGSASFDGSANASITATVANDSHTHDGRYYTESETNSYFNRFYNNVYLNSSTDTASFIAELTDEYGCFQNNAVTIKCAWSYSGNSDMNTGHHTIGTIELAGCTIETWGGTYKHVRITRPNTGTGSQGVYEYNDQGTGYSPGWREIWTSESDGSGSGLDADTLDGKHASDFASASHTHSSSTITSISSTVAANATAGIAVGAVGSYALLVRADTDSPIYPGSIYAGSVLRYSGFLSRASNTSSGYYVVPSYTPSGTWRAMGSAVTTTDTGTFYRGTLFLRIS